MCSNYRAVTRADRLLKFFGVEYRKGEHPVDTWPTGMAPFIRLAKEGSGNKLVVDDGLFGLLPHWQAELAAGRKTYNARSETVHSKPSYRHSWKNSLRCVIPAEVIYEPNWETGEAVRWAIHQPMDLPMGIAGIYSEWTDPKDGEIKFTFSMLTVNADGHPIFSRMHRPEDEKRMVVILDQEEYGPWLTCSLEEAPRFFRQYSKPLEAEPRPLAKRAPRTQHGKTVIPPPADPELF